MLVEIPKKATAAKRTSFPPHRWALFKNADPSYEAGSWETEEQAQKHREGFIIATGASFQALVTLAGVFDPSTVQIIPWTRGKKRRSKQTPKVAVAAE